uniref:Uncharacterized protein n=1 Tax=Rhizophora mucronata TaxID=61149 RepID=A0A2P2Q989_RHIMU
MIIKFPIPFSFFCSSMTYLHKIFPYSQE